MDDSHPIQRYIGSGDTSKRIKTAVPRSLNRPISPPLKSRNAKVIKDPRTRNFSPHTAAVESGEKSVDDKFAFFSTKLLSFSRIFLSGPRLPYEDWIALYKRNRQPHGQHFVIHQHDHPVAGTHYDLRLQCNEISSLNWAIMYGMPGNPNSTRSNRAAVETRVHSLWNHLIEIASHSTGSMLIWDTGEYTVLPYHDDKSHEHEDPGPAFYNCWIRLTDSEKLRLSFSRGKIRIQLRGARLPSGYTIRMWLAKEDKFKTTAYQSPKPRSKRRRISPKLRKGQRTDQVLSESEEDKTPASIGGSPATTSALASSDDESEAIRVANAYPGAVNDVGSVHQRRWYLCLDRDNSGFCRKGDRSWTRKSDDQGFKPFHVMGREVERSVVTGRLGKDILNDEGVEDYVPRGRWRPIVE